MEKLEWSALEYEEKNRNSDWFWALGVIVVASSAASAIYGNYFFAILIILGGVLLGFFSVKKPEMITYELNTRGLKILSHLYPYERIKSFWVQVNRHAEPLEGQKPLKPTLFVRTERQFMPILSIPIDDAMAEEIHSIMTSNNVPEEEMREHASEKIMEFLGF